MPDVRFLPPRLAGANPLYSIFQLKCLVALDQADSEDYNRTEAKISEEGWGEFDMRIIVSAIDKGGDHELSHDLNFQQERYEAEHKITFKNPKPNLLEKLKESGPVGAGGEENGVKSKRGDESAKKRKRSEKGVDMEKLAESLQRLGEEDLLQVVEMVHNNKTADTYTKNDVEQGEFHVDLYTLPDSLVRMLWDFCVEKLGS
ncbi:MAG: hypothetical protein Q9169_004699 [Polycauliona sp. 2 TL-2023]